MNKFKLLEISDSYKISDFIKQSDIFIDKKNNIIGAHYNIQEFDEVAIREYMFNYEILCFASVIDSKIDSMLYYVLPKDISNVTSIELKLFTNINSKNCSDFIKFSVFKINEIFEDLYKRITIYIKEEELNNELKNKLKELNFEREILLKNELGMDQNVIIFVKTI
ncbi:hypothetical protein [Clostridium sardiniense]|uniref:hypothetical protein n=1 Tax=Clostridium sardiniense TaxID=29369 RepID=UPI0019569DC7|nr:hypothetical protein [Clostridium sardiniense]MBM7836235.1 hypothetical protein [Clostridium sardiniense]